MATDDTLTWVDPAGTPTSFWNPPTCAVMPGKLGFGLPPAELLTDALPLQPGSRLRSARLAERELTIPLFLQSDTMTNLRTQIRNLRYALDPTRGDGTLQAVTPDGSARQITCRYQDGLQGNEQETDYGYVWQQYVLVLKAVDPYWYDVTAQRVDFSAAGSATPFLGNPFFPLHLSNSTVLGAQTVTNAGMAAAWPVWTITGPGSSITLTNTTTGDALTLNVTLTDGQVVTIDTRPGKKLVTGPGGANYYGYLASAAVLWSLPVGASTVQVAMAGATSASLITLTYQQRFLGL